MSDEWAQWFAAARREDVDAAMRTFYAELDAEVARGGARCDRSGRCCKFDSFGHRLYVTALEVAWFLENVGFRISNFECKEEKRSVPLPILPIRNPKSEIRHSDACPYQQNNLCTAHTIRPLGCRVFFCQEGTQAWQQDLYEKSLARLKAIHAEHGVPYRYLEWRGGLDEAMGSRGMAGPGV